MLSTLGLSSHSCTKSGTYTYSQHFEQAVGSCFSARGAGLLSTSPASSQDVNQSYDSGDPTRIVGVVFYIRLI
jgi:hypothetical protein